MWLLKFLVLLLTELSLGSNRSNLKNLERFICQINSKESTLIISWAFVTYWNGV